MIFISDIKCVRRECPVSPPSLSLSLSLSSILSVIIIFFRHFFIIVQPHRIHSLLRNHSDVAVEIKYENVFHHAHSAVINIKINVGNLNKLIFIWKCFQR